MAEIKKNIYWTGFIDWDLRNFHGYSTPSGSTYNSYLIVDEKPTLIDTVKDYGFDEMLRRIKAVIDPSKIKYIVSNHTEMDHSGSIERLLEYCPDAKVVCSPKGEQHLKKHFKKDWNFKVVNTADTIDIGKRKLSFLLTPMVHWPDNMVTYCESDKILFSNDAFGQHYASGDRFVDEVGIDIASAESAKYYANIILPFGSQVQKVLEAVEAMEIDMVCPSHGLIWREKSDIDTLIGLYKKWSLHKTEKRVLIVYDTMWHSTERMAKRFFKLIDEAGIPVTIVNLQFSDISDIVTEVLESKIVLVGSPILNNRILPTMAALLMYLKGLKPKNRLALTFGSYGWATVGFKELESSLVDAGFELMGDGVYQNFIPGEYDLERLVGVVDKIKSL